MMKRIGEVGCVLSFFWSGWYWSWFPCSASYLRKVFFLFLKGSLTISFQGKYGLATRGRKGTVSEKSNSAPVSDAARDAQDPVSSDNHDETHEEEVSTFQSSFCLNLKFRERSGGTLRIELLLFLIYWTLKFMWFSTADHPLEKRECNNFPSII